MNCKMGEEWTHTLSPTKEMPFRDVLPALTLGWSGLGERSPWELRGQSAFQAGNVRIVSPCGVSPHREGSNTSKTLLFIEVFVEKHIESFEIVFIYHTSAMLCGRRALFHNDTNFTPFELQGDGGIWGRQ